MLTILEVKEFKSRTMCRVHVDDGTERQNGCVLYKLTRYHIINENNKRK